MAYAGVDKLFAQAASCFFDSLFDSCLVGM